MHPFAGVAVNVAVVLAEDDVLWISAFATEAEADPKPVLELWADAPNLKQLPVKDPFTVNSYVAEPIVRVTFPL